MSQESDRGKPSGIPVPTIQAFSRTIFKEASQYGVGQLDVIRLINELMDLCSGESTPQDCESTNEGFRPRTTEEEFTGLPVVGSRISLRAYQDEDRHLIESWLPDRYGRYFVLSCATAQEITIESLTSTPGNHLGMICLEDGSAIGAMAYLDHSRQQERAELRKLIGDPDCRGKGLAEEATRLWVSYGIHGLGLKKIYVSTLQTQIANIRLNESIGFQVEGLLKNEVLIDGQRRDVLRMGLVAADFLVHAKSDSADNSPARPSQ